VTPAEHDAFTKGVRSGIPFALAGFVLSVSFGALSREAGFGIVAPAVMSLIVFAGSAQFAALAVLASGGAAPAAIVAATLMNSRFLPMGVAFAPSLSGPLWKRAAQGQMVVDASWVLAVRSDGTFDRWRLFGATTPQFIAWQAGTITGVVGGRAIGDLSQWGLDAVFPAFFVSLLVPELRRRGRAMAAVVGGLIALVLIPIAPPGVPVLAAGIAALYGLTGSALR